MWERLFVDLRALGANLKRLRKAKKLSQDTLAVKSGVSRNIISELELGRGNPTMKTLAAFEKLLGEPLVSFATTPSANHTPHAHSPDMSLAARLLSALDANHVLRAVVLALALPEGDQFLDVLDPDALKQWKSKVSSL